MSVYKPAKSRFFHFDFVSKGRRFCGSTGCETRRKAEQVERTVRDRVALGLPVDGSDALTLNAAAVRWWEERGADLKSASEVQRRIKMCLKLFGKDILITDINTDKVARAIQKRRGITFTRSKAKKARKFVASNRTVNLDVIDTLRPILRRAARAWEVKGLPVIDWAELRLPEPKPKPRDFAASEIDAVVAALPRHWHDFARLQALYGARLSEMFFKLSDINVADGRLTLRDRKGGDDHTVPLMPADAAMLAARMGRARAAKLDTVWFRELKDGRLKALAYGGAQKAIGKAMRESGLHASKGAKGSHDLRHHSGMQMLRESGNLRLTQKLLGHASIQSTLVYAHAMEDDLRAGLAAVSRNSPEPATTDEAQTLTEQGKQA